MARKTLLDGAAENCEIARRRDLFAVWQAGGIGKMRAVHPESMRLQRHKPGETFLVPADGFGDCDRYVIGRTGDDCLDRVVNCDRFAGMEAKLGRSDRGWEAQLIFVAGIKRPTGIAVDNDCRDVSMRRRRRVRGGSGWTLCDTAGPRNGFAAKHGGGGANGGPRRAEQ